MSSKELEELVSIIRQFIQKARNRNDAFEYCRLCEELRMAEAALASVISEYPRRPALRILRDAPLLAV